MKRLLLFGALCLVGFGTTALWAQETTVKYKATYYINGVFIKTEEYAEGEQIALPVDNPGDIHVEDNLELVGWLKDQPMEGSQLTTEPTGMVTEAWMGTKDVSYYAVFAEPLVYRLSAGMIEKLADRDWSAAQEHRYTNYEIGGRVDWYLRGYKEAAKYGNDKFIIGDEESTSSYIGFKAPKAIEKITVGALYYDLEKNVKRVFPGTLYINTGIDGTTVASKTHPSNAVVEFDVSSSGLDTYYLQAGGGDNANYNARIYTVKLECGLGAYRSILDVHEVTIASSGYGTICLPWHADIPDSIKAYRLKDLDLSKRSGQLCFTEVSSLTQNQGYLLKGIPGKTYKFYRIYSDPAEADSTNYMYGAYRDYYWTDSISRGLIESTLKPFILNNGCFKQYTGDYIPAKKAFIMVNPNEIQYDNQQNSAELRMVLEDKVEETSELAECIEELEAKPTRIYDLSGKQVPQMKRGGFYIVNGKSVLVK